MTEEQLRSRLGVESWDIKKPNNTFKNISQFVWTEKSQVLFFDLRLLILPASAIKEVTEITLQILNPSITESISGYDHIMVNCVLRNKKIKDYYKGQDQFNISFLDLFDFCRRNDRFATNGDITLTITIKYNNKNSNRKAFITDDRSEPLVNVTSLIPHYSCKLYKLPITEQPLLHSNVYAINVVFVDSEGNKVTPSNLIIKNLDNKDITSNFHTEELEWGRNSMSYKPSPIEMANSYLPVSFTSDNKECIGYCYIVFF